jgi:hypothetical protein
VTEILLGIKFHSNKYRSEYPATSRKYVQTEGRSFRNQRIWPSDNLPLELYYFSSFETFTTVMFQVKVFWVMRLCSVVVGYHHFRHPLHPEDGGSMFL